MRLCAINMFLCNVYIIYISIFAKTKKMKPAVYSQMYVQLVFAVKNSDALLHNGIRHRVFEYISGIISEMKHKAIIVNGVSDHIHIFIGMNPNKSVSDTVFEIKRGSSLFINKNKLCKGRFYWQEGYGSFTYSRSHISNVYNYILNQEKHHQKQTFRSEYIAFLEKFNIEYDEKYLFSFLNYIN
jgi:putative transposase